MPQAAPETAIRAQDWTRWTLMVLIGTAALRLAMNALGLVPVHFDEAQYWGYGQTLALGHYSKPPLTGWLMRLSTELLGVTPFGLRAASPLLLGWIGWLLFATGRRLFDARTGFWAAVAFTLTPGAIVFASVMTTDPVMMAGWAAALYALARALERPAEDGGGLGWWAAAGAGVGAAMLGKYTGVAFALSALGYAIFSRQGPARWRGPLVMALAGVAALSPNLWWNAANGFVTVAHLGENASLGGSLGNPVKMLEFFGAQFGVFGPVLMLALLWMAARPGTWRDEWRMRLLMWLTAPLIVAMTAQAFLSRANPNWAAPAYVAGSLLLAAWLLDRDRLGWLKAHAAAGAVAFFAYWGLAAFYDGRAETLPRAPDPFKKMRGAEQLCGRALDFMEETGAEILLSDDRRRLAECMFAGDFGQDRIAIWNPDGSIRNEYELVASLRPGDARPMVLMLRRGDAGPIPEAFAEARELETGEIATHADRSYGYTIWYLRGFLGYAERPAQD